MVAQAMLQNMLTYWQGQVMTEAVTLSADRLALLNVLNWGLRTPPCWLPTYQLIEQVSPLFEQSGLWEDWQAILQQTQQVAKITADEAKAVNVTIMLARLAHRQGNLPQAVRYYKQVIRLARHEEVAKARACSNLGYIYVEQGRFLRAEVLCCHALVVFEEKQLKDKLAHTHNHLGVLYTRWKRWPLAETHLQQAKTMWQGMVDTYSLIWVGINLGGLYLETQQPDKALFELHQALLLAEQAVEKILIATIFLNLGVAYYLKQDFEPAKTYTQQAESIFQHNRHQLGLAQVWHNLGLIYQAQHRGIEAKAYFMASIEIWRSLGNHYKVLEVTRDLMKES